MISLYGHMYVYTWLYKYLNISPPSTHRSTCSFNKEECTKLEMLQIQEMFKIAKVYMPFSIIRNGVLVTFEEFIFNLKEMLVINESFVTST